MTLEKFNESVSMQLDYCKSLLIQKGEEYAPNAEIDRLASFKIAGSLQDVSSKEALCGMLAKHVVSVYEMCRTNKPYTREKWIEKITDTINYMLILRAMIDDETE